MKLSVPSIRFYTRWERGKAGIEEDHSLLCLGIRNLFHGGTET